MTNHEQVDAEKARKHLVQLLRKCRSDIQASSIPELGSAGHDVQSCAMAMLDILDDQIERLTSDVDADVSAAINAIRR